MTAPDVFRETFGRMPDLVRTAVDGLGSGQLAARLDPGANPVGWLVWHLTRVQDHHLAGAAGALGWDDLSRQLWTAAGFAERSGLPFGDDEVGYGQSSGEVATVRLDAGFLLDYHDAVHARTLKVLDRITDDQWDAVVDERWDPPVTLLARLASVLGDVTQHVGQAAYVRGVLERR
ncbi:MAG: DinB family protein [Actinomycetota bacterium]|nr:DinB family protein [Actinomycetota bacterium]